MCSFDLSRLDYCNSLLIDITSDQMYRLKKKIQNHAAKVVFRKSKHEHITPLLKKLHWLPVKERILFKIATFACRFFDGNLPPYLSSCLSVYTPFRTLRSSSDEEFFSCAKWKIEGFGYRSFSVHVPLVWNSLPPHIRHSCSLSQFKTSLQTFLYTSAFSELPWFPRKFEITPHPIDCWCLCVADASVRARVTARRRDRRGGGGGETEWEKGLSNK